MKATDSPVPNPLQLRVVELESEVKRLELQVKDLRGQLYGASSERVVVNDGQALLFADPAGALAVKVGSQVTSRPSSKTGAAKGPKAIDPNLPRVAVPVPCPSLEKLMCPVTGKLKKAGFVERIEVLSRKPAVWYVKKLERVVYVSTATEAPVYSEWPADVLSRSKVDASVVAYIAAQHYGEHQPFNRIEDYLGRLGVDLPRVNQVSLMDQLEVRVRPLYEALVKEILASDYLHLDATPVDLCDPARPGATRESTLWAYRTHDGRVAFIFELSKSPTHPSRVLAEANFKGLLQTDGASGFDKLGTQGQVTHLGCLAHARRYFFNAVKLGELNSLPYLEGINRLFRMDRLSRHFKLGAEKHHRLRVKYGLPLFEELLKKAEADIIKIPPKTKTGESLHYLLAQRASLHRSIGVPGACLDNNAAERAIRPLKIGAKNWLHIGHPSAGPRLAHLFSLVENCRLEDIDPEAYLADIITRLPDHPMSQIAQLLPRAWKQARTS